MLTVALFIPVFNTDVLCKVKGVSAGDGNKAFLCSVRSVKSEYSKGETVEVTVDITNTSLYDISDVRTWIDYPQTDYYLTPGATEHFAASITDTYSKTMKIKEDEGFVGFASKIDRVSVIKSVLLKLAHFYKKLTLFYTSVSYRLKNRFFSLNQKKEILGSVNVVYDGADIEITAYIRYTLNDKGKTPTLLSEEHGTASACVTAVKSDYSGIVFGCGSDTDEYGLFLINPSQGKAFLYSCRDGRYFREGQKTVRITAGESYEMRVCYENGRVLAYIVDDDNEENPYPAFDTCLDLKGGFYGVFSESYSDFKVSPQLPSVCGETYVNPVYGNSPDPFILSENGQYYLYATTGSTSGFCVSVSDDLVNWRNAGYCAVKGRIFGTDKFWAPEVYKYRDGYYLLYSTDEHIALAVSDSPYGPFEKTKDGYLLPDKCIDGHILFDDDGSLYLFMAYWYETGEEIWACRLTESLEPVTDTLTRLTTCKDDEGGVNEGPFVLKHDGKYYLTYSVNGYTDKNYNVRLAVSDTPLGVYEPRGTVLEWTNPLVGTGHHSFTYSPDGTEMFIVYHCHSSVNQIHNRKLCIDRCRFVMTENGYTLKVYGPTGSPQPVPSKGKH